MSFGVEFVNNQQEIAFERLGDYQSIVNEGTTQTVYARDFGVNTINDPPRLTILPSKLFNAGVAATAEPYMGDQQVPGTAYTVDSSYNMHTETYEQDAMAFYQLPTGTKLVGAMGGMVEMNTSNSYSVNVNSKQFAIKTFPESQNVPFFVLGDPGPYSGPETTGMQAFDDSGNVLFDSRHKKCALVHKVLLSAQQVSDVLNSVVNEILINLPGNYPDCYVCIPRMYAFKFAQAGNPMVISLSVERVSGTQWKVSRHSYNYVAHGSAAVTLNLYHSVNLFFADRNA